MKRTLSLVLALVMVLGTFTTVFAATEAEKTAAEFLEDEGILLGADGDLMLDKNLERRDAVILLSRLLGVEDEAAEFLTTEDSPSWEDARTDAYYVPFFAWAEENGYFEGDDEGNFNPRNAITAQEYALVLLRALDYDVKGNEAWKAALETAEELGLLKDVEVENKDEVVRGQMAAMTFNALGTKMNDSDETLAEKLGIEMPEDPKAKELTAEVNDTENLAEVVVELSNAELADELRLENTSNYVLNGSREVVAAEVVEDNVVLTVVDKDGKTPLVRNREYTLTIRGIDRAINGNYKFTARDNSVPTVESVEVLGEYGIKVTTSEPVQELKARNVLVDGKRITPEIEIYGREIIIRQYRDKAFDKDAQELEILELEDYAGYKSASIQEEIEIIKDEVAPEIVRATMSDNKVTIEFDKDIYKPSLGAYESYRDEGNASYKARRTTVYATNAKKVDTNKVEYTFEDELPRNVEVTIEGVQNHSEVTMARATVSPELVSSDYDAIIANNDKRKKLEVYNNEVELEIEFNKALKEGALDDIKLTLYEVEVINRNVVDKYNVSGYTSKGLIKDVNFKEKNGVVDYETIIVTFEGLEVNNSKKEYDYILEIDGLRDKDDNRIYKDYFDFEVGEKGSGFMVVKADKVDDKYVATDEVIKSRGNGKTIITINFNNKLDKAVAENPANYIIDGEDSVEDLDGEAFLENGGRRVVIEIPEEYKDFDGKKLEVLRSVVDSNGNRLSKNIFAIVE